MKNKAVKKPLRTAIHSDKNGNKLIITHYEDVAHIKLKLFQETRERNVGTLSIANRILYVSRIKERHLFHKLNAYGLNHYIIKEAKLFDNIVIKDETKEWCVPREFVLEHGKFLNFSNHGGFELQIFINLDIIKQFEQVSTI